MAMLYSSEGGKKDKTKTDSIINQNESLKLM